MTTLAVFTLGAVVGGIIAIAASYNHLVGLIQDQDAQISRLREAQSTLAVKHASLVARLRLGEIRTPSRPETLRGEDPIGHDCLFGFRSPECGYVGLAPTCDHTLWGPNGCETHDNVARYGGKPGMKALTTRKAATEDGVDSITCDNGGR